MVYDHFQFNQHERTVKSLSRVRLFATPWSSLPGSPVRGILQAIVLEWVAIPFSKDLFDPEIEPRPPALQMDSLPLSHRDVQEYDNQEFKHCCCWVASAMSDSMRPHRRQPTRLPRPWDSPGKNTGVGCHFLLQCMKVKSESEVIQSCPTLSDPMDCSLPGTASIFNRVKY